MPDVKSAAHCQNKFPDLVLSGLVTLTLFFSCLFLSAAAKAGPEDPEDGGQWGPVIAWPHIAVSAANLPDGRILTWSGSERDTWPSTEQTYSATWDPATNSFEEVFHPTHNMFCAHLAMLEDGRVFVTGGRNATNSPWTSIFDYRDDEWVQIENMASGGRWYPTTIALADGDIFTAMGTATLPQYPERWNPASGWQIKNGIDFDNMVLDDYYASGTHGESRWWPLLHVAPNGQIFHSGPTPKMHYIDPDGNGDYQQAGAEFNAWYHKHGTTIMYGEGKLLTAGGWISGTNITSTNQAFTIDLNGPSPTVELTGSMKYARKFHNGVMLPNGEVLVIGGNTSGQKFSDNGTILNVEIWNPDTGIWREGASMAVPRNYHSISLLMTDGRVLAAGSGYCSGSVFCNGASHKDGEVYSPPYLFNPDGTPAARPSIQSAPGRISSGEIFSIQASAGMQSFSLIKMSSTSHGVNTDVRFVDVSFQETTPGTYQLTANGNQNVLTPGYWMLFAINANGVPSVAHVVQANTTGLPWIAPLAAQTGQEGVAVNLQIVADDADNDPLVFSGTGLPPGLSLNSSTGLISGTPSAAGSFTVTITANDNDEGTAQMSFGWTVVGQGLGSITREWWTGIAGNSIAELTSSPNYPGSPSGSDVLTTFEAPTDWAENYGTRIRGYLVPDTSGTHTFWIASDDNGELWLSTDNDPANRVLIATVPGWSSPRQWDKFPEQQSVSISLQAGQSYYIEALQKEGGGGDNLAVAWQRPGDSNPQVISGAYLSQSPIVGTQTPADAKIDSGTLLGVGSDWTTVTLPNTYNNMVVIATPQYDNTALPAVTRIRNAGGNQFDVRVQNPSDSPLSGYVVHYLAIEAGLYQNGIESIEAVKFQSTVTDENNSWVGESRNYLQTYSNPVVVGQVMSSNDPGWSVFWASSDGNSRNPPSATSLAVGKHVAEDSDTTRAAETIGYLVVDSASGMLGDYPYTAAVGPDIVRGVVEAAPYVYPLSAAANAAVISSAGMDGTNGGWPVLYGDNAVTNTELGLGIDEDQINDNERVRTTDQVAYLVVETDAEIPVNVDLVATSPQVSGSSISLAVDPNVDYLLYSWSFGDGTQPTPFSNDPTVQHSFGSPGRYVIAVTVQDPNTGEEFTLTFVQLVHAPLTANLPTNSSPIAYHAAQRQVWNVNPDNDTVTVIDTIANSAIAEIAVGDQPVSVAVAPDGNVWVINKNSASLSIIDSVSLTVTNSVDLPAASRPHGLAMHPTAGEAYVALQGTGDVLRLSTSSRAVLATTYVGTNPRHVSVTADGARVLVSRFITQPLPNESTAAPIVESGGQFFGGEIVSLDSVSLNNLDTFVLQHSDRTASEHTGPGIPNYLGPAVISPDGLAAWIPSKQDNILAGALRGGFGMTFDQTVRAITSKIDLTGNDEVFSSRIDHDNAGVASHAVFGPYGIHLFTALESNREVVISDAFSATELIRFDVGRAPQGLTISDDGNTLYVHNFTDRSVSIFDVSAVVHGGALEVTALATVSTVANESLSFSVLRGKQFFYDARDPRLALDSYMSCASCHNDGRQDGRVWDFTGVGEGLRNTISLEGRGGVAHGFLHWSSNFDEVQDFEGQIRNFAGGTGLMNDAEFSQGTRSTPLGDSKAGISGDLDALAAYVSSLTTFADSPHRNSDGTLTADGQAGLEIFEANNCASCHTPPRFTDSAAVNLHDVGTMTSDSGLRLGGPLDGIDTPTLISIWDTGPYLHDGSVFDVTEAVQAHSGISLTSSELTQLGAYLDQLDSVTALLSTDPDPDPDPDPNGSCGALMQEAESGTLAGQFVIAADANASGGQYIEVPVGTGGNWSGRTSVPDIAEYCFTVTTAGTYRLKGLVQAAGGGSNSFWVTVDGLPATGYFWDMSLSSTYIEDYVNDRGVADPVDLVLAAGDHTVKFYWRESGTRLDTIELEPVEDTTSTCGPMTQEAEAGTLNGNFVIRSDGIASGGQYIVVSDGTTSSGGPHSAEFCFDVPSAGVYSIVGWVHGANSRDDSFYVRVDDQGSPGYLWEVLRNTSYLPDFVSDRNGADPVQLNLSAGPHTVTLYWREDGTRIDKISLQ